MSAWEWPQWVIVAHLILIGVCRTIALSKMQDHAAAGGVIVAQVLIFWVLWMGGFWS